MFQGSAQVEGQRPLRAGAGRRRFAERHHQLRAHQLLRDHARPRAGARALARGRPDGLAADRPRRRVHGEPARRRQERAPPALRQRPVRHGLREADGDGLPGGPPVPPHPDRLDGRPGRAPRWRTRGRSSVRTTRRTTRCCRSSATSTPSRRSPGSRSTSARSPAHDGKQPPRDGTLPDVIGERAARGRRGGGARHAP